MPCYKKLKSDGLTLAMLCLFLPSCETETVNTVGRTRVSSKTEEGESSPPPGSTESDANTGETCAKAEVSLFKPTVLFVVDRSGSTLSEYPPSTTRWQAMYDALMDSNNGVIAKLQSNVFFGMVLYDGGWEDIVNGVFTFASCWIPGVGCPENVPKTCPNLAPIRPALNNYDAIKAVYGQAAPGLSTPTARALEEAYKSLSDARQVLGEKNQGPQFVVLCTDGLPNGCMDTLLIKDEQGPINQVSAGAKNDIKTYIVSVAADTEAQAYLEKLASYGNTGSRAFSPENKDDLVDVLRQIVGGAIGCKVKLNGRVTPGQECRGTVKLNGEKLPCNTPDGWKLVSDSEIELQGKACTKFMKDANSELSAAFPCEIFIIL